MTVQPEAQDAWPRAAAPFGIRKESTTAMRLSPGSTGAAGPRPFVELHIGHCSVAVGGLGTVDILARYDPMARAPSVTVALPYSTAAEPADCLVQTTDWLVIRSAHGVVAEIPVQLVLQHVQFAGFSVIGGWNGAALPPTGAGMRAFEDYLATLDSPTEPAPA